MNLRGGGFLRRRRRPASRDGGVLQNGRDLQRKRAEEEDSEEVERVRERQGREVSWRPVMNMGLMLLVVLLLIFA